MSPSQSTAKGPVLGSPAICQSPPTPRPPGGDHRSLDVDATDMKFDYSHLPEEDFGPLDVH